MPSGTPQPLRPAILPRKLQFFFETSQAITEIIPSVDADRAGPPYRKASHGRDNFGNHGRVKIPSRARISNFRAHHEVGLSAQDSGHKAAGSSLSEPPALIILLLNLPNRPYSKTTALISIDTISISRIGRRSGPRG